MPAHPPAHPLAHPFPLWRRLLAALLALLTALSAPAMAQVRLPALGESASEDLTIGAERRIGEQIMREGRRDPDYLDDPVLLAYLQSMWKPLLAAARAQGNIEADTEASWSDVVVRAISPRWMPT